MIVDFHTHVFPPEIIARRDEFVARDVWLGELYGNPKAKMATVDDLLASMETNQIDAAVAFPFGWRDSGLARECNSYIIQAMSDHPGPHHRAGFGTAARRTARRRRAGALPEGGHAWLR